MGLLSVHLRAVRRVHVMPASIWVCLVLWVAMVTVAWGDPDDCTEWERIKVPNEGPVAVSVSPAAPHEEQPINITCTVTPLYRAHINSSRLYVKKYLEYNMSHPNVEHRPAEHQIVMHIPHPHHDHWSGASHCYIRGINAKCIGFVLASKMTAHITFRRQPLPMTFDSCVVHNWESLVCDWKPSWDDQMNHTRSVNTDHRFTYQFFYHLPDDDEHLSCTCDAPLAETFCRDGKQGLHLDQRCVLGRDQFQMGEQYELIVYGETEHGWTNQWTWKDQFYTHYNTSLYVKPDPPRALMSESVNSTATYLSWSPPHTTWHLANTWTLTYMLSLQDSWGREAVVLPPTNHNSTTIRTDPYTKYQCNMTVIPAVGGYQSAQVHHHFTTPSTEPVATPVVSEASYEMLGDGKVRLYWKPIQAWEQGGENFIYVVRTTSVSSGEHRSGSRRADDPDPDWSENHTQKTISVSPLSVPGYNSGFVDIPVTADTNVLITSCNTKGEREAPDSAHSIRVLVHPSTLDSERLIVEIHSDNVQLVTFTVTDALSDAKYVVFWMSKDQGTVDWYESYTAQTPRDVLLPASNRHFNYGLARIGSHGNTGIDWSRSKSYLFGGFTEAITEITHSVGQHEIHLRWVSPKTKSFITRYIVHYCMCDSVQDGCHAGFHDNTRSVPGETHSVTLFGLERGQTYCIYVASDTQSDDSGAVHIAVRTDPGLSTGVIVGIAIAGPVALVLIILGIYWIYRKCRQGRTWYTSGYKVELPEEPQTADSASSDTHPFLHYSFHNKYRDPVYHRTTSSMSTTSMDSGQFSLAALEDCTSTADELTLSCNSMINSYAKTGYVASPTPLRSIPEDGDTGDVFDPDPEYNNSEFVETYRVMPEMSSGGRVSVLNNSHRHHSGSDQSKNGIGNYTSIALRPGSSTEDVMNNKTPAVGFRKASDCAKFDPMDIEPPQFDEAVCQYTTIQPETKPKDVSTNPFTKAMLFKPGRRSQGRSTAKRLPGGDSDYVKHDDVVDGAKGAVPKVKKLPPSGYVPNNGTRLPGFAQKTRNKMSAKQHNGYVPNDGSFDGQKPLSTFTPKILEPRPATVGGYIPNDGSFVPRADNSTDADLGGKTTSPAYVVNDGSFDPSSPQRVLKNDQSLPATATEAPPGYVSKESPRRSVRPPDENPYVSHEALRAASALNVVTDLSLSPASPDLDNTTREDNSTCDPQVNISGNNEPSVHPKSNNSSQNQTNPTMDSISKAQSLMALSDSRPSQRFLTAAQRAAAPPRPQSLTMAGAWLPAQPTAAASYGDLLPYRACGGSMSDGSAARLGSTDTSGHGSGTQLDGSDAGHSDPCNDINGYISRDTLSPVESHNANTTSDFEDTCSTLSEDSECLQNVAVPVNKPYPAVNGYTAHAAVLSTNAANDKNSMCSSDNNCANDFQLNELAFTGNLESNQDNNNLLKDNSCIVHEQNNKQLEHSCLSTGQLVEQQQNGCLPSEQSMEQQQNGCLPGDQLNKQLHNGYVSLPV